MKIIYSKRPAKIFNIKKKFDTSNEKFNHWKNKLPKKIEIRGSQINFLMIPDNQKKIELRSKRLLDINERMFENTTFLLAYRLDTIVKYQKCLLLWFNENGGPIINWSPLSDDFYDFNEYSSKYKKSLDGLINVVKSIYNDKLGQEIIITILDGLEDLERSIEINDTKIRRKRSIQGPDKPNEFCSLTSVSFSLDKNIEILDYWYSNPSYKDKIKNIMNSNHFGKKLLEKHNNFNLIGDIYNINLLSSLITKIKLEKTINKNISFTKRKSIKRKM